MCTLLLSALAWCCTAPARFQTERHPALAAFFGSARLNKCIIFCLFLHLILGVSACWCRGGKMQVCCSDLLACCRYYCYDCCPPAKDSAADRCLAVADHWLAVVLGVQVCLLCVPCLLRYLYVPGRYIHTAKQTSTFEQRQTTSPTTERFSRAKRYYRHHTEQMTLFNLHCCSFRNEWHRKTYTRLQTKN